MPIAVIIAIVSVLPARAAAAAVECAPKPDNPVGYQVTAVHADAVDVPASTPPIAVLDSGVADVPELAGRLRDGFNATNGGHNTADVDGHGTAVATVAAGAAGGVRGISPSSPILPVKIFNDRGESTPDWLIAGIKQAVALGAGVINISAEGPPQGTDTGIDRAIEAAIDEAVTKGVPVIAPSGNDGAPRLGTPASYPHVVAVGATDESGLRASFSNTGSGLDLAAPGENITTAAPSALCASGYALVSGTSFAAPAVSGAAALLLQAHPGLDVAQLTDLLRLRGQRSSPPAWASDVGFGLMDVLASVRASVPPADAPEVDDTIGWSKRHPPVLTPARRSAVVAAHIAPHSDPSDTFRVRLRKGDRLRATAKPARGAVLLRLSDGRKRLGRGGALNVRIRRAATYYVTVAGKGLAQAGTDYSLRLRR